MESEARVGIDLNLDNFADIQLVLTGAAMINRSGPLNASVNFPSVTGPAGHAGPDVIDTEIISMTLVGDGATMKVGTASGTALAIQPTLGAIAEVASNPSLGDSFFDIFLELDLGGGQRVYNQVPHRFQAYIHCVPPLTIYFLQGTTPISLYSAPSGGTEVARLITARHSTYGKGTTIPTVSVWGAAAMALLVLAAGTIVVMRRRVVAV
jgi:hypothetical protein